MPPRSSNSFTTFLAITVSVATASFFEVSADRVAAALRLTRGCDVTPESDVVEDEEARLALNKARKKRERFNFDMVGIKPGTELQFHYGAISHEGEPITVEVASHNRVTFEGKRPHSPPPPPRSCRDTALRGLPSGRLRVRCTGTTRVSRWTNADDAWSRRAATSRQRAEAGLVAEAH